jgi:hypothetical protein
VAWAVLVALGVILISTSRWRWWIVAHPILTVLAVVATGNHWWFDGIVAVWLIGLSIVVERSLHFVFLTVTTRSDRSARRLSREVAQQPSAS